MQDRNRNQSRFAFVVPRFGEGIAGGAETLVAELAQKLLERGDHVEVFTTCAFDNRTWSNHFPPGKSTERGLTVHRFLVDQRDLDIWVPLQVRVSEGMALSAAEQIEWMKNGVNSQQLYRHLYEHGDDFDAIFLAPYLFATTIFGALIHPQRSILIPCLHDEYYAYTGIVKSVFRAVRGSLFNAHAEMELAHRLYGEIRGEEVGMGFQPPASQMIEQLRPYFCDAAPYLVYLGRKETGKNAHILLDYFVESKRSGALPPQMRLVIQGAGSFEDLLRPEYAAREDIIDLPHLSEHDKQRVLKHAVALCQPSVNESFSIVLMEAWNLAVPVIVHADCAVTRQHVLESGGGLYFADSREFGAVVAKLFSDKDLNKVLAEAGARYVREKYCWEAVLKRFDKALNLCFGEAEPQSIQPDHRQNFQAANHVYSN